MLFVKLAERLTTLQPDLDAYRLRPPFIRNLELIDEKGAALSFEIVSYPHVLYFHTAAGDFGLTFQDAQTLALGLPSDKIGRAHV